MRLLGSLLIACGIALGLFLLMMFMVSNSDTGLSEGRDLKAVNFIRFDRDESRTRTKDRRQPPDEPPPEEPPPPAPSVAENVPRPEAPPPELDVPDIETSVDFEGGPYLGDVAGAGSAGRAAGIDTEVVPVVQVPPKYPATAKRAKIEGHVTMEFTVRPDGSVSDIRVVDAQPPRMFNRAAKEALSRWKFRPRERDGERVARNARQTIRFTLD
ncbi:TonB2 protein [Salinisphaera sp. PC39]|uniref:energy transducer TonB n=1 Tax=Salinisphaera sp. PC39 TaxID=1304156 RepID=UPI00333F2AE1